MFTWRIKPELVIEGSYAVNVYIRYAQEVGYSKHNFLGQVIYRFLGMLQYGDKAASLFRKSIVYMGEKAVNFCFLFRSDLKLTFSQVIATPFSGKIIGAGADG